MSVLEKGLIPRNYYLIDVDNLLFGLVWNLGFLLSDIKSSIKIFFWDTKLLVSKSTTNLQLFFFSFLVYNIIFAYPLFTWYNMKKYQIIVVKRVAKAEKKKERSISH